jgi:membrane protein required for beta-lactamase induction
MPPVIFLVVVGAAGLAGYRLLSSLARQGQAAREQEARMRRATAPVRDLGNLEWDETAGVYRPRQKRDN